MKEEGFGESEWIAIIARSLSYLCLNNTGLREKTVAQKAIFLSALGLSTKDIAAMVDSTPASVAELMRQSRVKKKVVKKNAKSKKGKS